MSDTRTIALPVFECDRCGACCSLILEASHEDALREPRIAAEGHLMDGRGDLPLEDAVWLLNSESDGCACVFLGEDKRCGIYATRPHMCVAMQAGSEQCQMARGMAGMPALEPTGRNAETMIERVAATVRVLMDEEFGGAFVDEAVDGGQGA